MSELVGDVWLMYEGLSFYYHIRHTDLLAIPEHINQSLCQEECISEGSGLSRSLLPCKKLHALISVKLQVEFLSFFFPVQELFITLSISTDSGPLCLHNGIYARDVSVLRIHSKRPVKCARVLKLDLYCWRKDTSYTHTHTYVHTFSLNRMEPYSLDKLLSVKSNTKSLSCEDGVVGHRSSTCLVQLLYLTTCKLCLSCSHEVMSGMCTSIMPSFHIEQTTRQKSLLCRLIH